MYTYLARKRDACVKIHPLIYTTYLVWKHVARVERKAIYVSLVLSNNNNNNNNNNNFNSNILVRFFRNYLQTIYNL